MKMPLPLASLAFLLALPHTSTAAAVGTYDAQCSYYRAENLMKQTPCTIDVRDPKSWDSLEFWHWEGQAHPVSVARIDGMLAYGAELAVELDGYERLGVVGALCYRITVNREFNIYCRTPIGD